MKTIWFNNSSVPLLQCGRRYVLNNVIGLRQASNEFFAFGSLFHHWMRVIEPGDTPAHLIMTKPGPARFLALLSISAQSQAANLAIQAFAALEDQPHVREKFFEFDTTDLLLNPDWLPANHIVKDAGTLDRAEIATVSGLPHVGLTDFKTTYYKLNNSKLHIKYTLSGQLKFYAAALRRAARKGQLAGTEFEPLTELMAAGRFARRYLFVTKADAPEKDRIFLQPFEIIPEAELDMFDNMLTTSRDMFVWYTVNPTTALKTGQLNDVCSDCQFTNICLSPNEAGEQHASETWPFGKADFNPKHDNE